MWAPFQTTIWTAIRAAVAGQSTAVAEFVRRYRAAVAGYIRARGYSAEDAEDLTQEVFLNIYRHQLLERADRTRGPFRAFLLSITRNVLRNSRRIRRAAKRGRGLAPLSLDALPHAEGVLPAPPDPDFDRHWVDNLIRLALDQLWLTHPRCSEVIALLVDEELSYEETARRLGMEVKRVDNLYQQARRRLSAFVRREIAGYCSSGDEVDEELTHLSGFFKARTAL
jgi:RNA polymerase sigma-70 factor (ECF subfamily)